MNRKLLFALLLTAVATAAGAQETMRPTPNHDDFGTDVSLEVEKKIASGISVSIEGNHRSQADTHRTDRWQVGGGLDFRLFRTDDKKLTMKGSVGFDYAWKQSLSELNEHYSDKTGALNGYNWTANYWRNRYRISTGISANYTINKRWSIALKETFQYTHNLKADSVDRVKYRYNGDDELYAVGDKKAVRAKDIMLLRSKFTLTYNIRRLPVNPFASVEYCAGQRHVERWKYTGGVSYNIQKKAKLSVFYRYQTENDDDDPNGHFVGWSLKFNL